MTVFLLARDDGSTLALTDDPNTESPFVVSGFSPYLKASLVSAYNQSGYGEVGALDVEGGRPMSVTVNVKGWPRSLATVTAAIEQLDAFMQPSLEDIYLSWDDSDMETRGRWVRSQGLDDQTATEQKFGSKMRLDLRALDPRTYGPPITADLGASPTVVALGGKRPSATWRIECPGPCTNPHITYDLPDGSTVDIIVIGAADASETFVASGRFDELYAVNDTSGEPRWAGFSAEDAGGRAAVLWPIGPGDVTFTFDCIEHSTGHLTAQPAY